MKTDANDILRAHGRDGLRQAIDNAPAEKAAVRKSYARPAAEDGVVLLNGAEIAPRPVAWLWRNHLQRGSLNLLAGRSTVGKSTIALNFAATITSGGQWPDGQACKSERVVFWSGEDDVATTLLPRFIAADGDRAKIAFIEAVREDGKKRPFNPAADMPALGKAIDRIGGVGLIVLDPIALAVRGDSHKNVETRVGLQPFCDLCAAIGAAGLGVHHFTKNTTGGEPLDRISGSLAFGALPRAILVAARDQNDAEDPRRALMRAKVSNGPDWGGFDYRLDRRELDDWPGVEAQRVMWGVSIEGSARDLLERFEAKPTDGHKGMAFLRAALKHGPRLAKEVIGEAEQAGINERTLRRAFKELGGTPDRQGGGRGHFVIWELPQLAS